MKIAVFSDIHSNLTAVQACLAYARHLGVEGYIFLGDLVTGGAGPSEVLGLIRSCAEQSPCWFVRGNREELLLEHHQNPNDAWIPSSQYGSLLYSYQNMTQQDIEFLSSMPITQRVEIEGCPPLRICHGSPSKLTDLLFPGTEHTEAVMRSIDEDTILVGHSHIQFRYESRGKQLLNPGAIGIPRFSPVRAQFALIQAEQGRWAARMLNVDYDAAAELARIDQSEFPEMAGVYATLVRHALVTGQNRIEECIQLAQKLGQCDKDQIIPDKYWEAAAHQMGI
ncbi:metallophosphatase family protein [Eubacteriales bacterium OttesenSCG-928-N13]|nr:metallophosphatase family protein [Eubacteriales bacterium OttesenSCG-928-N13]